jgi:hypothetical protein
MSSIEWIEPSATAMPIRREVIDLAMENEMKWLMSVVWLR